MNEPFGEYVKAVIGPLSLRRARILTGIDHDTLWRMKQGDVPRRIDPLFHFARGFARPVNEVLEKAGMEPIPPPRPKNALLAGIDALVERYGALITIEATANGGLEHLTAPDDIVPQLLAEMERTAIAACKAAGVPPPPGPPLFLPDE